MAEIDGVELKRLVSNCAYRPRWEPLELGELKPGEVRVTSEFTAAKHGTEKSNLLKEEPGFKYQRDTRVFDRLNPSKSDPEQWRTVGNTTVGTVTAVGNDVKDLKEGDRVYGYGGFQTVHQSARFKLLPEGLTPEAACCLDPADFALAAVRDGQVRIGETVVVFGMGAIGLFAVQLARMSGAVDVIAVDPIAERRELAMKHGATETVDPNEVQDFGSESRKWVPNGADVTIEASGSYHALNLALQTTRYAGTIVPLAFYQGGAQALNLGYEFHQNQLNIISARACSHPQRELYWEEDRIVETLIRLFAQGDLNPYGLPGPIVGTETLAETYGKIRHAPDEVLKVAVRY